MTTRVIGLGQSMAGDDGVGLAIVERLREEGVPDDVDVVAIGDPALMLEFLRSVDRVVIVDALVGDEIGTVAVLSPADLGSKSSRALSSHGLSVPDALALASALTDAELPRVTIVAVSIPPPIAYTEGLSAEVAAAIPSAVATVRRLLEG